MKRLVSLAAAALFSAGLLTATTAPAHAYDITYTVSGSSKAMCLGGIDSHVRKTHNKAPRYLQFAKHSGCKYNAGFKKWIAAVSYNYR